MSAFILQHPFLTSSLSTFTASLSPVKVLDRNDNRGGFSLSVSGSSMAFIGFNITPVVNTTFNIFMKHGDYFFSGGDCNYTGEVYVVWNQTDSSSLIQVTEFKKGGL